MLVLGPRTRYTCSSSLQYTWNEYYFPQVTWVQNKKHVQKTTNILPTRYLLKKSIRLLLRQRISYMCRHPHPRGQLFNIWYSTFLISQTAPFVFFKTPEGWGKYLYRCFHTVRALIFRVPTLHEVEKDLQQSIDSNEVWNQSSTLVLLYPCSEIGHDL